MFLSNSYYYFKEALAPETCRRIIGLGLDQIEKNKSLGISVDAYTFNNGEKVSNPNAVSQGELTAEEISKAKKDGKIEKTYIRDSKVAWLNEQWLYDLILPYVEQANFLAGWNWQWDYSEQFQFTVYEPGGLYGWHKDGGSDHNAAYKRYMYGITPAGLKDNNKLPPGYVTDPKMVGKVRKISLTINLNEPGDYEGGNLKFDFGHHTDDDKRFHEVEEIRPQGSVIIFPSFLDHCVTPIVSGTRYSLVLWVLGDPWK
jgi:PKHD-type hydroxylase